MHPFEEDPTPLTHPKHTDADELPVDVALGKVDYMEILGFSDHQATAGVWYRLLNLGFHLPAAGGTDAMADYAMLRGPVGMNRTYVSVPDGPLDHTAWLANLKAGRSFATNGPLLEFTLGGKPVGETLSIGAAQAIPFTARVRSIVPLDTAQVVCNGKPVQELTLDTARQEATASGTLPIGASGWCLLRAFTAHAEYPVLDNFVYATTSPVYVTVAGRAPRSPAGCPLLHRLDRSFVAGDCGVPGLEFARGKEHGAGYVEGRPQGLRKTAVAAGGVVRAAKNSHWGEVCEHETGTQARMGSLHHGSFRRGVFAGPVRGRAAP